MSYCIGVTKQRKICDKYLKEDDDPEFCSNCLYQKSFPAGVLKGILNGTNTDYKVSPPECTHWHNGKNKLCDTCNNKRKGQAKNRAAKKKENLGGSCEAFITPEKDIKCDLTKKPNSQYCKRHNYIEKFTEEERKELSVCSTPSCHKTFHNPKNKFKTCQICRKIGEKNREGAKEKDIRNMCLTEGCKNHENLDKKNGYCGICDKASMKKKAIIDSGMKVCHKWHHNSKCLEKLDVNDKHDICSVCRGNNNETSVLRRNNIKDKANELNIANVEILKLVEIQRKEKHENVKLDKKLKEIKELQNIDNNLDNDYFVEDSEPSKLDDKIDETKYLRICTNKNCGKTFDLTHFKGLNGETTVECQLCRDKNKVISNNRIKKPSNVDPEKQKAKLERQKEYRQNNTIMMSVRDKYYRLKEKEKLGEDEYNKKNAENAKAWRENNVEKLNFLRTLRNANEDNKIKYYKMRAEKYNIGWNIFDYVAKIYFKIDCKYCGEFSKANINGISINGIDRENNKKPYSNTNCCPCCETCNFMKGELGRENYLNMIKHIMSYMSIHLIDFKCPELFGNHCSSNFNEYKLRAEKKQLIFELTEFEFGVIQVMECYMCGRQTTNTHTNGIDRVDNKLGYTLDNCLPCCGTCNFIKNKYDIFDVCRKMCKAVCYNTKQKFEDMFCDLEEFNVIVKQHLDYEKENLMTILEFCKNSPVVLTNIVAESDSEDEKPKKITKVKKSELLIVPNLNADNDHKNTQLVKKIKQTEQLTVNNDSEDEKLVKIKKRKKSESPIVNNFVANNTVEEKSQIIQNENKVENPKRSKHDNNRTKNIVNNAVAMTGKDIANITGKDLMNAAGVNKNSIKNKIRKTNELEKFGEDGYKRKKALEEQRRHAKSKGDEDKVKRIDDELAEIKSGTIKPGKKVNLTVEQKRENERLRKAKNRKKDIEKYGAETIKKKAREEQARNREKKKGNE